MGSEARDFSHRGVGIVGAQRMLDIRTFGGYASGIGKS